MTERAQKKNETDMAPPTPEPLTIEPASTVVAAGPGLTDREKLAPPQGNGPDPVEPEPEAEDLPGHESLAPAPAKKPTAEVEPVTDRQAALESELAAKLDLLSAKLEALALKSKEQTTQTAIALDESGNPAAESSALTIKGRAKKIKQAEAEVPRKKILRTTSDGAAKGKGKPIGTVFGTAVPPSSEKKEEAKPSIFSAPGSVPTFAGSINKLSRSVAPATLTYNPALADRAVNAKNLLTDQRFLKMAKTLMRFSLEVCADKVLTSRQEDVQESRKRSAQRLRQALVELGPTFIKLGQFLSVRRDCLSVEMADELAMLQDKVPPFSLELVRKTITSELGGPPERIFQSFDEKPIASASIGQVHRAVLHDGRPVVVKVQRPDLAHRFYQDLGCMRLLAHWGLLLKPEGQWQSWMELSDEFGRNLFQEINYIQEGRNADRVRTMLKDQPEMQVPRVYWKFTGRRVLTLEYCPGIKIDRVKELEERGFNAAKIGNQLVNCYLEMVLMHGFFHADPHAGNLCVAPDGRITIYDFGMMGEITDEQREGITGCIASVIKKDTDELVKNLKNLGIIRADAPAGPIIRTLQPFIDYYAGKPVKDLDFSDLEHDIDQIAYDRALLLPPTLAYLLRAGTSLEGIARTLKPNFSFVEAAKAPLKKWVMSRPHHAASLVKVFINGNLSIGQEVFSKLANGKPSDAQTKATKNDKPGKIATKPTAVPSPPSSGNSEELSDLKSRIFMLENQLKAQSKQRYFLAAMALWLLFSAALGFPSQLHPYVIYFLIGNGVMGAIIMWHLVTHLRPDKTPTKGTSRGQRR